MPKSARPSFAWRLAIVALLGAVFAATGAAQSADTTAKKKPLGFLTDTVKKYGLVPQHFTIGIGGYVPSVSSSVQLSSSALEGDNIDLENKLGLHRQTQSIEALATLRLGSKQLITFGYFGFRRNSDKTLNDSVTFGDTTYHAGAMIAANSSIQYYGFTYRFYFVRKPAWELGAGLGIDALVLGAGLKLQADAGGGEGVNVQHSGGFTAPAPMIGIYGDWEFIPRFYFRGQLQYLYVNNIATFGGHVTDDKLAVEWFPLHNYGFGAGYHFIDLNINKDLKNGGNLDINYNISGAMFYLTAAF
jgi:hypothetical protein